MTETHNHQRDTEALILQAAEREFLEKGYSGAKTTAIAQAAGVTHAMLHYYFRTKEKLFEKIVADKMDKLKRVMFGVIGNPDLPLRERLKQGVEQHFDFIAENPHLPRFIFNELHEHPERIDQVKNSIASIAAKAITTLQNEIDRKAASGECRPVDARMLMLDIASLNLFPFIAAPLISSSFGNLFEGRDEFLEMRKKENVRTVLGKLGL